MKAGYIFTHFPFDRKNGEKSVLMTNSFIIIDKKYGPMIFDTGSPFDRPTLVRSLKERFNLTPEDFQWVFLTHLHPDHYGANNIFKNATIVMSKEELKFARKLVNVVYKQGDLVRFMHEHYPGYRKTFGEFEAMQRKKYIHETWSEEKIGMNLNTVFIEDNPELPAIITPFPTPGHSLYHYSFIIDTGLFKILVAGDALSMRLILREEKENRFLEPHADFSDYFKSVDRIKKLNKLIFPGHDRPFFLKNLKSIRKQCFNIDEIYDKYIKEEPGNQ